MDTDHDTPITNTCLICGKPGDCLTPEQRESIERSIAQVDAGEVVDLGSFAEFADEDEDA